MASDVASTVISTASEWLMSVAGQEIDYAWNCNDYIGELTSEVEKLKHVRGRVRRLVKDAKRRGEKIEPFVDDWLRSANQFIDKAENFLEDKDRARQKCVGGLCHPWKTRYEMGRKVKEEMLPIVNELKVKKESFNDGVSYREGPKGIGPIKGYEEFESRKAITVDILKALADPNVYKIGIYGINGVGKTTLAREIARQVEVKNLFDEVVMATVFPDKIMEEMQEEAIVKKTPNIRGIQDEIADVLAFHFCNISDRKRADELCERLKDENRKLIILDNVWAGLDLKDVGIPNDHEGCKILLISTNKKVLSDEMDSKHNFQLDVLTAEDSEEWFKKMVGDVAKAPDLEEYVTQVAHRCTGLPILLMSVAKGLKDNGDLNAWKDALKQLSSFDKKEIHAKVDLALQLSYNLLRDDEIKRLFLLCAQLGSHGISIRNLFRFTMGLGLFKGRNTVEEVHFRLLKLLNDLKSCCLLLETGTQGYVKMHDIVHNFAVSVAYRDHHVFIPAFDSLLEWPTEDVMKQLTAITLPFCKITELPQELDCPNLESFLLFSNDRFLKIPPNFFGRLSKVKALYISGIHLLSLPQSFEIIQNLRTLCLEWCHLGDMTMLGMLKTLRVLSFEESDIVELPKQVKNLTQLQVLNLNGCKRLELIQPNVLSSLALLEELCMEKSFLQWEFEGRNSKIRNASMDELKLLPDLKILDIHVTNINMLPKGSFFEKLERFKIFIGDGWSWSGEYKTSRTLKLNLSKPGKLRKGIKALLKRAEDLYLNELKGIGNSLDKLDGQGFPQLKHLHLENSCEIQYIITLAGMVACSAFTSLELLFLDNLEKLEKLCHGRLSAESFGQLTILTVGRCGGLKNLFSSSMARGLMRLKEITVTDCKILEEIVCDESDDDAARDEPINFAQLHMLELQLLPQLKRFCSNKKASSISEETGNAFPETDANSEETASKDDPKTAKAHSNKNACFCGLFCSKRKGLSSLETEQKLPASDGNSNAIIMENDPSSIFNKKVSFPNMEKLKLTSIMSEKIWHDADVGISSCIPNLTSLVVDGCDNMKCLLSSSMAETLGNLKTLEISNCKLMEEIILAEGLDVEGKSKMKFQKLDSLYLKNLPKLACFCNTNLLKCSALKKLTIDNCSKLKTFISSTAVNVDSKDQTVNSALFDEKVAFPNLEILGIFNMSGLKTICDNKLYENSFSKLKRLELVTVEELRNVFPSHYLLRRFQNLEVLCIDNCNSIEKVFDIQDLKDVKAGREMVSSNLRILDIRSLPKVKCIWNNEAGEIHSFKDLRAVIAINCPNMISLFPLYMARNLRKLTSLQIVNCGIEEIISYEEGTRTVVEFVFPQLTNLELWKLPQLKRFYPGKQTVEFPKLKYLEVYGCDNIEIFTSESKNVEEEFTEENQLNGAQQPLISAEKVIPNLEILPLNGKDVKMISGGQSFQDLFPNVKVLFLQCFHDVSTAFPFGLIQKFVNLKELVISNSCFTEIFSSKNLVDGESQEMNLPKIEFMLLALLYNLKYIELDHVLENLGALEVVKCDKLGILAPSSASFKNLIVLTVQHCNALVNLVTFSTAKSMVQLHKLVIQECDLMTEVLENDGEDEKDLVLYKLESLMLVSLKNLSSFCSAKWNIKFPSLEEVVVVKCPKMRTFSNGSLEAAKLRGVNTKVDERRWRSDLNATVEKRWRSDLNATIENLYAELVGFNGLTQLRVSEFAELAGKWPKQIPESFMGDMISLVVDKCASSSIAVPSNLLSSLKLLQELEIRNCDSVEEVFDNERPNTDENSGHLSKLVKFHILDLPKLSKIWNQYSSEILNLKNLKLLKVHNCGSLRNIFTPSMATSLVQLEEMEIKSCHKIEEIIAIEEVQKEGAEKIEFPLLNSVTLENLPKLRSFYFGNGSVEFPSLKKISVIDCPSAFLSTFLKEEPSISEEPINQPVALPSLETLILEWNNSTEQVLHSQCREDVLRKLKCFELVRFSHDHSVFPYHFLRRLSSLENLAVRDASFEEIVLHEEKNDDDNLIKIIAQLRELKLSKLPKLKFLPKDTLKSSLFIQNLESLEVLECDSLEILVPASVSFRCLKSLEVSKCHGLRTVITSSTAKSLVQLTTLSIHDCEMVQAIITHNDDGVEHEIVFSKLKHLRLHHLIRLRSFCLGMCKLSFPSLEELKVTECPDMETISQADLMIPRLKNVEVTESDKVQQLLAKMGDFQVQSNRSLTWQPTKVVRSATLEKSKTFGVSAGQASDISIADKSATLGVPAGQPSNIAISEKHTTLGVSSGEASDISIAEKSTALSFPAGQASDIVIAEKNIKLSVPVEQASDIATEEKNALASAPGERVSDNFQASKNLDSSSPVEDETIINVTIEERATSTQSEIIRTASATQDSRATSIPEENATQNGLALHKETHISVQILKHPQNDQPAEDVVSDLFNQQTSTIPVFPSPGERATLSTAANSTMTASSKDLNFASSSSHTPADFESLFASMEDLLKPQKDSFAKPSTSLFMLTEIQNSKGATAEDYAYSMDLIKKILKKSLTEVARSADAHKLLISLRNLTKSPNLNPQQLDIIQDYIENFDSLVAYHPFYQQQIDMGSSINHSFKEKQRRITDLKTLYQDSVIKADTLGKTKEELKKKLHEIEEEENRLRASIELLYSDLVSEKGELKTDIDAVPEAVKRQKEAMEKARKANDSWEKLQKLFI